MQFPHPNLTSRYGKWDDHEPIIVLGVWIDSNWGISPQVPQDSTRGFKTQVTPSCFPDISVRSVIFLDNLQLFIHENNLQTWVFHGFSIANLITKWCICNMYNMYVYIYIHMSHAYVNIYTVIYIVIYICIYHDIS